MRTATATRRPLSFRRHRPPTREAWRTGEQNEDALSSFGVTPLYAHAQDSSTTNRVYVPIGRTVDAPHRCRNVCKGDQIGDDVGGPASSVETRECAAASRENSSAGRAPERVGVAHTLCIHTRPAFPVVMENGGAVV